MADILTYLFIIAVLALGAVAVVWVVRSYANGHSPTAAIFGQANVDGRRRLVLIRRDGIEHLIMTGGPVDVVIETGIGDVRARSAGSEAAPPVFARPPRSLGQAQPAAAERVADRAAE
jgi:flagellar protein FliO/FliZ